MSVIDRMQWTRVLRRVLTSSGNVINLSVTATATSVTWTFPRGEVDTNFGVSALPSWSTTVACTSKSTTGLTLTFGTAAPANATVDVSTFRTE